MKNHLSTFPIYAALLCLGYIASLFLTYGFIVMPALATLDDQSFVAAFQALETRFQNAPETTSSYGNIPALIAFPGAIIFSIWAAILHRKENYRAWIFAGIGLFLMGMITTVLFNLPANEAIFTAGVSGSTDFTKVRIDFNEVAWANWNHFRTMTTLLSFVCILRALYLKRF